MTFRPYLPPNIRRPRDDDQAIEDAAEMRYAENNRCRHRGETTVDLVACNSCGGRKNLPAYRCELHDCLCVELRRPVGNDVKWCHSCADRAVAEGGANDVGSCAANGGAEIAFIQ